MSALVEWLVGKANHRLPLTPQAASNAIYQSKPGPSLGSHKWHVLTAVVLPGSFWNICIHPYTVMRRQMAWKNLEIQEPATSSNILDHAGLLNAAFPEDCFAMRFRSKPLHRSTK
ncbi:uncharacterized protein LOC117891726 isoform X3 [Drosophila subobscura]|uniref:uncharacterized protein LOC117891726 isoform X3 n=1 Tax=Drosophila subobscura TaxID=7241 RepID=UPI00155A97CF|nr:uncharacterized protein LOC117891726 isoform X3 [Drosophila subobscura]